MSETVTTTTPTDVDRFHAACAALTDAETALRRAQERAGELEGKADQLDREAGELDQQRGDALARGRMADAKKIGERWAAAHDAAKAARAEAAALRRAVPDLEADLLTAEEHAQQMHNTILSALYLAEREKALAELRPRILRLYRLALAQGANLPWEFWARDLAGDLDPGPDIFGTPLTDPLPLPEAEPRSRLLGHGYAKRSDIRDYRARRDAGRKAV